MWPTTIRSPTWRSGHGCRATSGRPSISISIPTSSAGMSPSPTVRRFSAAITCPRRCRKSRCPEREPAHVPAKWIPVRRQGTAPLFMALAHCPAFFGLRRGGGWRYVRELWSREVSSAGRASRFTREGRRFESVTAHRPSRHQTFAMWRFGRHASHQYGGPIDACQEASALLRWPRRTECIRSQTKHRRSAAASRRACGDKRLLERPFSDRFLELLGGSEGNLLRRLDLDRLAGCRIAAHASGALAHHQNAEPADADAVALLEMLGHQTDQIAEHGLCLLFRHLVRFREIGGEMLQRDCRCRFLGWRCHG